MRSSTRSWRSVPFRLVAVAATLALALTACGASDRNEELLIRDPWLRPPQGMDRPAAGYMVIVGGNAADALLSVKTAAAGMVEIHETTTDASGMTGMHPIGRLEIPAGETVTLEPGGYHLMLMGIVEGALEPGKTVELELTFEELGLVVITAEVRAG
jgi:copper(I)-binding protein